VYGTGIAGKQITAGSMFMDVVTDFGDGYTPTDADNLERGPVRVRDALRFSLNIPAVKAMATIGNDNVQKQAEAMGVQFRNGEVDAGLSFALGVEEVHPKDLVRAYGTLADGGKLAQQTTLLEVKDSSGTVVIGETDRPDAQQVMDPGAAGIVTDILSGNTDPDQNPFWGEFRIRDGNKRRPATLKTGTNNDARDLNAYGYIAAPSKNERKDGEYALAVGVWNGNSDNSLVSTPDRPLFSIEVSTFVWRGFLQDATKGWSINEFKLPDGVDVVRVDPWTGLRAQSGERSVQETFLAGTAPSRDVPDDARCGRAVIETVGIESAHKDWMRYNDGWLRRAGRGPGVSGGPENTRTAYFYNGLFNPYGRSWGPVVGASCGESESPSESASVDPCASLDPAASVDPAASPVAEVSCPPPSEVPSESPSEVPSESPPPTEEPTATPTEAPTATPTATPTEAPTPTPTPTEAPTPTPTDSPAEPASS
jgi:membrane peptidoglycan carboxypeptidase